MDGYIERQISRFPNVPEADRLVAHLYYTHLILLDLILRAAKDMDFARTITLNLRHEQAVSQVKQAFADQGFGTLTEIDVQATRYQLRPRRMATW